MGRADFRPAAGIKPDTRGLAAGMMTFRWRNNNLRMEFILPGFSG
jgi:hypothetical protein